MPTIPRFTLTTFGRSQIMPMDEQAIWTLTSWNIQILSPSYPGDVGNQGSPNGCQVNVLGVRYIAQPDDPFGSPEGGPAKRGYTEIDLEAFYPDAVDDDPRFDNNMRVSAGFRVTDGVTGTSFAAYNTGVSREFPRPGTGYVWNGSQLSAITASDRKFPTFDGHTATWPAGDWGYFSPCAFTEITFDFGDGATETHPLVSRFDPLQGYYGALSAPLVHTFTPDADNNGTGFPVTARVTDVWGRKSAIAVAKTYLDPHAEVKVTVDDQTSDLIFDSRPSYGRTGVITSRKLKQLNGNFAPTEIGEKDLDLDPLGRVFRVPAFRYTGINGATSGFVLELSDGNLGTVLFANTFGQTANYELSIERPNQSVVQMADGSVLKASEGSSGVAGTFFRQFIKRTLDKIPPGFDASTNLAKGSVPWGFSWGTYVTSPFPGTARNPLPDVAAPILRRQGARLYLCGLPKEHHGARGQIRLFRSDNQGRTWKDHAMIWDAGFYHAAFELLAGRGAISLALKRVAVPDTQKYQVELWFRRSPDCRNWDAPPTKIEIAVGNPWTLAETFTFFPLLLNQGLSGGPQILLAYHNGSSGFYASEDLGATWRSISG